MVRSKVYLLNLSAGIVIMSAALIAGLIMLGGAEPGHKDAPDWVAEPGLFRTAAGQQDFRWLYQGDLSQVANIRLLAAYQSGDKDSAYGLLLRQSDSVVVIAASPLGNVAIWKTKYDSIQTEPELFMPWQPWPHVRQNNQENQIDVTFDDNQLQVRINQEALWAARADGELKEIGIFATSFGDPVSIDFSQIALFEK